MLSLIEKSGIYQFKSVQVYYYIIQGKGIVQ